MKACLSSGAGHYPRRLTRMTSVHTTVANKYLDTLTKKEDVAENLSQREADHTVSIQLSGQGPDVLYVVSSRNEKFVCNFGEEILQTFSHRKKRYWGSVNVLLCLCAV
jgi:hypothetical protein